MTFKFKIIVAILIVFTLSASAFNYYNSHYSTKAILKNVSSSKGYTLKSSAVDIEFFVKPEWIPFDSTKPKDINIKVCNQNETDIILTQVWNRGNDIYFSFNTRYKLNYKEGQFLYSGLFLLNDSLTSNPNSSSLSLTTLNHEVIPIGQTGFGSDSSFSFGIEPNDYSKINDGFNVKYSGMYLYNYSLKK